MTANRAQRTGWLSVTPTPMRAARPRRPRGQAKRESAAGGTHGRPPVRCLVWARGPGIRRLLLARGPSLRGRWRSRHASIVSRDQLVQVTLAVVQRGVLVDPAFVRPPQKPPNGRRWGAAVLSLGAVSGSPRIRSAGERSPPCASLSRWGVRGCGCWVAPLVSHPVRSSNFGPGGHNGITQAPPAIVE